MAERILPDGRWQLLDRVGKYRVSTVRLLDFGLPGRPFETMVFEGDSNDDIDCRRYFTQEQAREGHQAMLERWGFR